MVSRKLAKIVRIFVDMGHIKTKGHILAQKNQTGNSHAMELSQFWSKIIFDWGNTKNQDDVCFHYGHSSHITQNYMADMPTDVKEHILNHHTHHAHIVMKDTLSLALAQ